MLAVGTILYALIFSVAAVYKHHSFWMGFDLGVHEQVLWNTAHGRLAELSPKGHTHSYLGVDIIIVELLLAPIYALAPYTATMLIVQVVLASSGAIPLFLLARDRSGQALYGLFAAFLYYVCLPVQYAMLYEFQIRTVGTVCFLWAFLFFERKQLAPFLVAGIFAIWTRSDASFAFAAMGLYALIHRRRWPWVVLPGAIGMGWLVLCLKVLIPSFRDDHGFLYGFIYTWLGNSWGEMARTMLTQPGYVAEHVLTPGKLSYLFELFAPLLFLPLLRPDILAIAMPSLMLNLLSPERIHWSIRYHYQAFIVPFLLIATVYVVTKRPRSTTIALLIVASLAAQLFVRSPLIHLATRSRDAERIAFAHTLIERVPDDAAVTATSAFGAHMARRREIYFFPGNVIYPPAFVERGEYLIADLHEVPPEAMPRLRELQQSERWQTLVEEHDFVLLKQETP